ncbi:MAG TPA: peptidylprolyl isomerase [Pyrinomonadaceae bacterium]|nr:peptidylprolyl isomerase [Pyrinomonadaceae bacterium]
MKLRRNLAFACVFLCASCVASLAQEPAATPAPSPAATPAPSATPAGGARKANERPAEATAARPEPFDGASVEKMAGQCVTLETDMGDISIEFFPESAPESVRNFLNLSATGMLDTTTFSRVVPDFVIQGGNLSTRQNITADIARRSRRTIPDEPSEVKHVRGVVSMARPDEPNRATTNFFILVSESSFLDGKFAAFGRVRDGMGVVDRINREPVNGDKPVHPVRIKRAAVAPCPEKPKQPGGRD